MLSMCGLGEVKNAIQTQGFDCYLLYVSLNVFLDLLPEILWPDFEIDFVGFSSSFLTAFIMLPRSGYFIRKFTTEVD